jgi:hypothetical protein
MMSINYNHRLRRQFTENILTYFKGNLVNVVVQKIGEGADRFRGVNGLILLVPNRRFNAIKLRADTYNLRADT